MERMGSDFLHSSDTVEEGDTAVIYVNAGTQYSIVVKRGHTLHMKYGALRHEFLIGKRYGTAVSASAGYVYVLRSSSAMWTRTLQKSTQILYTPDIGTILLLLDVKPGARICEAGTGSGSLSHAIATAVAPNGHLYSFDLDEQRVKTVQNDLKLHGLSHCATVQFRDVCQHGFALPSSAVVGAAQVMEEVESWYCDGLFLDLPAPWLAIGHAHKVLLQSGAQRRSSRLVSFSPCIEQVQRVCAELERHGFVEIETIEVVPQKLKVVDVPCESLAEFAAKGANAQAFFQQMQQDSVDAHQLQPQQQKGRRGSKRKANGAEEGTDRVDDFNEDERNKIEEGNGSCENSQNAKVGALNDSPTMLIDAVPCPLVQPTHTGYITSATLLPRINNGNSIDVQDEDSAAVENVCAPKKLSPQRQQQ